MWWVGWHGETTELLKDFLSGQWVLSLGQAGRRVFFMPCFHSACFLQTFLNGRLENFQTGAKLDNTILGIVLSTKEGHANPIAFSRWGMGGMDRPAICLDFPICLPGLLLEMIAWTGQT